LLGELCQEQAPLFFFKKMSEDISFRDRPINLDLKADASGFMPKILQVNGLKTVPFLP